MSFVLLFTSSFIISCLSLKATVNWYTNTNLQGNINLMAPSPGSFSGWYFCCGTFAFQSDGKFVAYKTSDVVNNVNYFRRNPNITQMYIVGGELTESALKNTPDSSFQDAINYAKSINIDGFVVDYEPTGNSNELAQEYATWLTRFKSIASKNGLGVIMCGGGWGILKYYDLYQKANLTYYTSMSTYYGSNVQFDEQIVQDELKYFTNKQIRSGIGSMTTPNGDWYYNWTSSALNTFLQYLEKNDVPSVDIWRTDIDYSSGYTTESWFYKDLANFMKS